MLVNQLPLSTYQWDIFNSQAQYRIVVAGRRAGKTFLAIRIIWQEAWDLVTQGVRPRNILYATDTRTHAEDIAWRDLKEFIPEFLIKHIDNIKLSIELKNGSRIMLRGTDEMDSLRGLPDFDLLILDEAAYCKSEAFTMVLMGNLAVRDGRVLFISTPNGYNWFYDLYNDNQADPDWDSFQFTSEEGGNISPETLKKYRKILSPKIYRQEYMASFETMANRVYYSFVRALNVHERIEDDGSEIYVGMDFNVDPMTASFSNVVGEELHTFNELELRDSNTTEMSAEINNLYPGRTIIICPDASGQQRRTSAGGHTDFQILEDAGFDIMVDNKNPEIEDRVNNTNAMLNNADGERRGLFNPRCVKMIKCFEGQVYRKGTSIPDKTMGLDHFPDGYGYKVSQVFPMIARIAPEITYSRLGI